MLGTLEQSAHHHSLILIKGKPRLIQDVYYILNIFSYLF